MTAATNRFCGGWRTPGTKKKYDILLLLQDLKDVCGDKGIGDYRVGTGGKIERNAAKTAGYPYMFGGISIVSRKIFADETREKFSLRDLFDLAQSRGRLGFVLNDAEFFHVGHAGGPEGRGNKNPQAKIKKMLTIAAKCYYLQE